MTKSEINRQIKETERLGASISRRINKISEDRDFLVETMITNPYPAMSEHKALLQEWDEEIERLEQDRQYLRTRWSQLMNMLASQKQ